MLIVFILFTILGLALFPVASRASLLPRPGKFAYVSGFTSPGKKGKGSGIEVFRLDEEGVWHAVQTVEAHNPSWLLHDPVGSMLYACQEEGNTVTAYAVNSDGALTLRNECTASSEGGVHLSLSPGRKFLVVANYTGGTVDAIALEKDGALGTIASTYDTSGPLLGLELTRSHPHMAQFSPDGNFVLVPDKGRDVVHILRFNTDTGYLCANSKPYMFSRPAVGSRHLAFHPEKDVAYLVEENDNAVTTCAWYPAKGDLVPRQWVSAIPDTWFPKERGGDDFGSAAVQVHPSGRFCFVSNRGHNSIGIFRIHPETGFLSPAGWESTRGVQPRFFCLDKTGNALFVANVEGHSVMAFSVAPENGKLTWLGQTAVTGSPNCVVFA